VGNKVNNFVLIINRLLPCSRRQDERQKMKTLNSIQSGFTLVEIMIVVAIIGLLATMAVPHFARSRSRAHSVACMNNLRLIDGAIQMWALENNKDADQVVTYNDISGYLKNSVVCPAGGSSFADSYTITAVDARAVCQRKPDTHKLPL
jgi:prepilin-type N-terminal cleavage/methylation domain-containing protein